MATHSIIQKSQLEGASRLDAEYYQPEFLKLAIMIKKLKLPKIKDLKIEVNASAFYPSIAGYYGETGDIPFIRVADVVDSSLTEKGLVFLPRDIIDQYRTIRVGKPGDIVITKGGTIGNAAILPEKYKKYAFSRDIIFLRTSHLPREQVITLYLFLTSKLGIFQLLRGATQQIQFHLTLPVLRNLSVPKKLAPEALVLYKNTLKEFDNSKIYYEKAENLLLEELRLKNFQIPEDLTWEVGYSEVKEAERMDSNYFQPKYDRLLTKIAKFEQRQIKDIATKNERGVQPKYTDEGVHFVINSRHILETTLDYNNFELVSQEFYDANQKSMIVFGDILFYTTGANVGRVGIYLEDLPVLASNHVNVVRLKKGAPIDSIYLAFVLNTVIGRQQIYREVSGAAQKELYPSSIGTLQFPVLPKATQQKIADLVKKSHKARKKSKKLLKEAKRKVEEMIEKETSRRN